MKWVMVHLPSAIHDNARSMRLLHQYIRILAQTGTVVDEKELMISKVGIIYQCQGGFDI